MSSSWDSFTHELAPPSNWAIFSRSTIHADSAWNFTKGDKSVLIAVIDTGLDLSHPAIAHSIWVNPGETGIADYEECIKDSKAKLCNKSSNEIDDDTNGYIDDVQGWNFADDSNQVTDNLGHGTHVTGIISGQFNLALRTSGVAPNVSIIPIEYYSKNKTDAAIPQLIKSITYAIKQKVRIINFSLGGGCFSEAEFELVKKTHDLNILVVAAAGNEYSDISQHPFYPASYNLDNIISVASLDVNNSITSSSNYGKKVDIAAPGDAILSSLPNNSYGWMSGTSMATPFVTGVAGLILSINPKLSPQEVKSILMDSADRLPQLADKVSSGKLNAFKAVALVAKRPWTCSESEDLILPKFLRFPANI